MKIFILYEENKEDILEKTISSIKEFCDIPIRVVKSKEELPEESIVWPYNFFLTETPNIAKLQNLYSFFQENKEIKSVTLKCPLIPARTTKDTFKNYNYKFGENIAFYRESGTEHLGVTRANEPFKVIEAYKDNNWTLLATRAGFHDDSFKLRCKKYLPIHENHNAIDKHIFIIGSGRCGTTWLMKWLTAHPLCFSGPETHLMMKLFPFLRERPNAQPLAWVNFREDVILSLLNDLAYNLFSERQFGCRSVLVDHTPLHFANRKTTLQILPNSKFVHIYRDGKSVIESCIRRWSNEPWAEGGLKRWCTRWIEIINEMINTESDSTYNTIHIKYEDIINNPEISKKITEFCGLEHHQDIEPWKTPINTDNKSHCPDLWKNLSIDQKKEMMIMNDTLTRIGYSPVVL